jgi:hypothetical protein
MEVSGGDVGHFDENIPVFACIVKARAKSGVV